MTGPGPLTAEVLLAAEVSAEEEQAIIDAFASLGVAARVRKLPVHRGSAELQWLILVSLPLQAFLSSLGSTMAQNTTAVVKGLISDRGRTRHHPTHSPQVLVLQDAVTHLQITLETDLPAEAYEALTSLDLSTFHKGPLHWDQQRRRWRSELDEQKQGTHAPPGKHL